MKVYIVMCGEQYECAWTVKVFKNKEKAEAHCILCSENEEKDSPYHYYLREIEADLDE